MKKICFIYYFPFFFITEIYFLFFNVVDSQTMIHRKKEIYIADKLKCRKKQMKYILLRSFYNIQNSQTKKVALTVIKFILALLFSIQRLSFMAFQNQISINILLSALSTLYFDCLWWINKIKTANLTFFFIAEFYSLLNSLWYQNIWFYVVSYDI